MKRLLQVSLAIAGVAVTLGAAGGPWKWSGSYGDRAVSLLILGDIQVHSRRADPVTAFVHLRDTLRRADLVYANVEGSLVTSVGVKVDIPDKPEWTHPGTGGATALKASNIPVVGVANNVAYGRQNILDTIKLLDAHGIAHAGAGRNIEDAHAPAIVERKGVKFGFLQYTARWYREDEQIASANGAGVARIKSVDGVTIDPGDLERLRDDVRKLRSRVDVVVVSHHNRDGGTPVQFGLASPKPAAAGEGGPPPSGPRQRRDQTKAEEYQKQFARVALDTGADLVFGHGTHTVQGVELYKGKPILYAIGHSAFDQPGYEKSKDGIVVRVVVQGRKIARVSFVPVTRDADNNVMLIDPSDGEGARVVGIIKGVSEVPLKVDGQEVVLLDAASRPTETASRQ